MQRSGLLSKPLITVGLVFMSVISVAAHSSQESNKLTTAEVQKILKANPAITSGFKSPNGTTITLVKPTNGGVLAHYKTEAGASGQVFVVAPSNLIAEKSFWDGIMDFIGFVRKTVGSPNTEDGGGGCKITITGNNNTVNCTSGK